MSQTKKLQEDLREAQEQIQRLSQELMAEREAAQLSLSKLQARLEQQYQLLAKLQEQESTYRHLFDCNPQPMWIYDLETLRFLAVNDAAIAQYGYSRDEFLAMTINDIRLMDGMPRMSDHAEQGMNMSGVWQYHLGDGQIIQVETVSFVHEFNGRLVEIVISQDVTDRQQIQHRLQALNQELEKKVSDRTAALIASETRLNLLINKNPATIYSCEPHGDYACKFVSKNVETLLGYTPEEFYAVPDFWKQQLHPDDVAQVFAEIPKLFEGGILKHEYRLRHRDGHYVWVHDELVLLRDDAGNPTEVMGFTKSVSDRKQQETQIKQQLAAMEAALDGIGITQNNVFIYANRAQVDMFGYSAAELLGQPWTILYSADELARLEQEVVPILLRDHAWTGEVIATRKDGSTFDQELSLTISEDGLTICISKDISDRKQAEIKLLNYAQQVEDLYNNAPCGYCSLDANSHITGINNTALRWLDYAREEVIGQPIAQFMTDDSLSIYEGERQILRQSGQVRRLSYEIILKGSDGGKMTVLFSEEVQKNANGSIASSRITITDIRQRIKIEKLMQQQLKEANLLRQISNRIRQTLDLTTIFHTACNEVRQALAADRVGIFQFYPEANYNDGEFIAEAMVEGFSSALTMKVHDHCFGDNFANLYAHGRYYAVNDIESNELSGCHRDILRQFQVRANLVMPLLRGENELWGLLCIHQCSCPRQWYLSDIDLAQKIADQLAIAIQQADLFDQLQQELGDRLLAEQEIAERNQQLLRTNAELERATRLKDEFLANMSHELRTPLNAILGLTESLQEEIFGNINEKQQQTLSIIENSGNHLLSLINDVLDVAKIEANQLEMSYAEISVDTLCDSSLTLVKQLAHKKGLQIHRLIPKNLPNLYGDDRRLRQVLVNLMSNAIKFTPEGGHVSITASYSPLNSGTVKSNHPMHHPKGKPSDTVGILSLTVTDTGIGISPENAQKLFQPFIQIDSNLNRQHEGTGLGLTLVKRITEKHGGQISLTSEVGQGSCFTVQLPIIAIASPNSANPSVDLANRTNLNQSIAAPNPLPPEAPSQNHQLGTHLILLAEDNQANVNTINSYLTAKGYRLIVANNGSEAISLANSTKPDLILMDIQMPQVDGLEAIRQIRQNPDRLDVPIIALTALAMEGDRDRCLAAGANEYISKPIRLKQLTQMMQTLLTN
ncbi:MAG: PAS domain S-box protein [Pseudanabaenaceae cyanobacterium bins.39]|nr:PAS domain S-box protein [Pseudanabaenaceae cyanobacterium bins.39]